MHKQKAISVVVTLSLIVGVAVGTCLGIVAVPYIVIGAVCVISILIAKGWIKPKYYPVYIFGMALAMLWQTSMMGVHVVGADIHMEYYVSSVAMQSGWDWSLLGIYNTSIVVAVLAPWISKIFSIELVWVYKIIFPVALACVPLIMYFVFRKQFGEKRAYWASLFFMIVPVMTLELVGNAKAMVAEVFFALTILAMVSDLGRWPLKHILGGRLLRGIILTALIIMTLLCHYTVGIALLYFLGACLVVMLVARLWKVKGKVSLAVLAIVIFVSCIAGYFYFSSIGGGQVIRSLVNSTRAVTIDVPENVAELSKPPLTIVGEEPKTMLYLNNQSDMVKVAIGLDFMQASTEGKVFRVVQYLTQTLLILGLIQLWRRRREYNFTPEFVACILVGFAVIGVCIFIPYISLLLNMTRYYHFSLFFLAPLFILGCEMIWNKKWFVSVLLLIYFAFTSGLVFEITQSTITERIDLPYSLSLSSERTGIVGVFNDDDIKCVDWLVNSSNQEIPIVQDVNVRRLLRGFIERYPRLFSDSSYEAPYAWTFQYLPSCSYYIFLSTWNVEHDSVILYSGRGLREMQDLPSHIHDLPIAFQSGKSVVFLMEVTK